MLGKRPRQMRRTVSISLLGSGSTISEMPTPLEYTGVIQKPHLDMPACYTPRQVVVSDNIHANEPGKTQTEIDASHAVPIIPFAHSGSRPRERKGNGIVGLSIVAALHADKNIEVKDYRERTISALVFQNRSVHQQNLLPSVQPSLACQNAHKQMQPQNIHMQKPSSSHRKLSSSCSNSNVVFPPEMHFLEACCYCSRRLSPGRDIYMYRGDKAFCSEQCRDQQILIDERKDKCVLAALRMRLAAQPADSSTQAKSNLATSTAAG